MTSMLHATATVTPPSIADEAVIIGLRTTLLTRPLRLPNRTSPFPASHSFSPASPLPSSRHNLDGNFRGTTCLSFRLGRVGLARQHFGHAWGHLSNLITVWH